MRRCPAARRPSLAAASRHPAADLAPSSRGSSTQPEPRGPGRAALRAAGASGTVPLPHIFGGIGGIGATPTRGRAGVWTRGCVERRACGAATWCRQRLRPRCAGSGFAPVVPAAASPPPQLQCRFSTASPPPQLENIGAGSGATAYWDIMASSDVLPSLLAAVAAVAARRCLVAVCRPSGLLGPV